MTIYSQTDMLKVVISGYGRMGHMIESVLQEKGIVCVDAEP